MLPYLDPELEPSARAADLVSRMTLEEKASQMVHGAAAIPRLDVPAYDWWNECIHGVGRAGKATVFPQAIGLAATFDTDLHHRIAVAISDEARAKHHAAVRQGYRGINLGLTYWSPTINILRDPRWGRAQETYGEDPYLTARLGVAFVKGLQGDHPKYLKLVATPKHFAAHNGPEIGRLAFDALVTPKDMEETYLPAFEACVKEARAWSVMGAYNRLNGEACCAKPSLLNDKLREEWGFQGYVVSDCGAIENIAGRHGLAKSNAEAAAMAVKAGCDLCCGNAYLALPEAVAQGLIEESEIDRALIRLFEARMRLGLFDPEDQVPYASIPTSVVDGPEHRALARKAAQESIVLLKNDGILPLAKDARNILVTGPSAANLDVLWGNYNGFSGQMTTLLEGIVGAVEPGTRVQFGVGCQFAGPVPKGWGPAGWEAPAVDLIIACMGLTPLMEGEEGDESLVEGGGDRQVAALPTVQEEYLKFLVGLGKPVVLVLTGGSPIVLPKIVEQIPAVLMAWYPGEEGGNAVADVLFGDANPSGRLPATFPGLDTELPPIGDYSMDGRTYRFCREPVQFQFGYGLSYTAFAYSDLHVQGGAGGLSVDVKVTNRGDRDGAEVVQLYVRDPEASVRVPIHSLQGFARVELKAGETQAVRFRLELDQLKVVLDDGTRKWEAGEFQIFVGGGQPGTPGVVSMSMGLEP